MMALILLSVWLAMAPGALPGAGPAMDSLLPAPACPDGWEMDGKPALYDRETLFERIDGEAEAYFPYGFDALANARYARKENPKVALDADVYRMGTPLDAFGIYAGYRRREAADAGVGSGGTVSPSQLIYHQGRYFVRIQATGTAKLGEDVLLACGREISRKLPQGDGAPRELEAFRIPGVVPRSERYIARSLLGYDFLRRGVIADAAPDGRPMQLFLVPEDSGDAASRAFEAYRSYLQASGKDLRTEGAPNRMSLSAVDPLYGNVYLSRAGRFLAGAVRFQDPAAARELVDRLRKNLGEE